MVRKKAKSRVKKENLKSKKTKPKMVGPEEVNQSMEEIADGLIQAFDDLKCGSIVISFRVDGMNKQYVSGVGSTRDIVNLCTGVVTSLAETHHEEHKNCTDDECVAAH